MAGFVLGGGVCGVCRKHGCVPSFHSFAEQEEVEKECADHWCKKKAALGCHGYCSSCFDAVSNTAGT